MDRMDRDKAIEFENKIDKVMAENAAVEAREVAEMPEPEKEQVIERWIEL